MKKASKVLTLLLVVVLVLGVFSGCGVFGRNTQKYRAQVAIKVGNEEITIGKLIDTYNTYYNSYSSYVGTYITTDDIFEMAISALYTQYMKIDAYKSTNTATTHTWLDGVSFTNEGYLTETELRYGISYIKYILYSTLDTMVEDYIDADYTLNDAEEEETADTSRDFVEYDDLGDYTTYSAYTYAQTFVNDEMDEYISDYYTDILTDDNVNYSEYVYKTTVALSAVTDKIAELNSRIDDEDPITLEKYIEYQKQALAQYEKNVQSSYSYDLSTLIKNQVEDYINSVIVAKYNYSIYNAIDVADLSSTLQTLKDNLVEATSSQKTDFQINSNFVDYIESLSDSSYVYYVPEEYNYIYVKNILIPFTTEQKTILSNLEKELGSTTDPRYLAKRAELASQIIADDYLSDKDDDGNYTNQVSGIFTLDANGNIAINTSNTELGQYFTADGQVIAMDGLTKEETIIELMKRFNTDSGQHSTIYDYVVRVGEVPESYTSSWVSEFVDAANDAYDAANGVNGGTYGIAISSYGVHIVYYTSKVEAQTFDFDANWLVTNTPEYRLFTSYYSTQSDTLLSDALEDLKNTYYTSKIEKTSIFDKFIKENGITFDFEDSLSLEDDED